MADTHDATFYVQLEPEWSGRRDPSTGERKLRGVKATRITQGRPERPMPGTVVIKLTTRIPDAAFLPLRPEAVIEIPTDLTVANPVEVTATDPQED